MEKNDLPAVLFCFSCYNDREFRRTEKERFAHFLTAEKQVSKRRFPFRYWTAMPWRHRYESVKNAGFTEGKGSSHESKHFTNAYERQ